MNKLYKSYKNSTFYHWTQGNYCLSEGLLEQGYEYHLENPKSWGAKWRWHVGRTLDLIGL